MKLLFKGLLFLAGLALFLYFTIAGIKKGYGFVVGFWKPQAVATPTLTSTNTVVLAQPDTSVSITVLVTHALSAPIDLSDKKVWTQGAQYLLTSLTTNHDMIVVYDGQTNTTSYLKANGFTWELVGKGAHDNKAYGVCNRTIQFQLTTNSPAGTELSIRVVPY